ncbi:MAG: DUF3990 domain-containing protein [Lachnospiraceae bacterium]|nr:DUF3990 domain-containing protein [Lachnospiraceae bacterium]
MILYHGSTVEIKEIDLAFSKPNKDFGKGFYLSDNFVQAYEMAQFKAELLGGVPLITKFEFNESILKGNKLKVLSFSEYSKEWAEFVFENRNQENQSFMHGYDIVIGSIANDRVGIQIRRFIEGDISFETFLEKLKFMKGITFQYYFGTQKAIETLKNKGICND